MSAGAGRRCTVYRDARFDLESCKVAFAKCWGVSKPEQSSALQRCAESLKEPEVSVGPNLGSH